eukprot:gene34037-43979_t
MASGGRVVAETSGKTITVKRNGVSLASGSNFAAGETLTIGVSTFSASTGSLVLEARGGATFTGGTACTAGGANSRVAATPLMSRYIGIDSTTFTASLVMPASGSVTILAGWAAGFGNVFLLPTFVLNAGTAQSGRPSLIPTSKPISASASPSVKPTTTQPVKPPTSKPVSASPSVKPTTTQPVKPPTNKPAPSSVKPTTTQPVKPPTNKPAPSSVKPTTTQPVKPPTNQPARPSVKPTTTQPVKPPTNKPAPSSAKPTTTQPVKPPTNQPARPSVKPTKTPSRVPTVSLTVSPTKSTRVPSFKPSTKTPVPPTYRSSYLPTAVPSIMPTDSPVVLPIDLWSSQGGTLDNSRNVLGSLVNSSTLSLNTKPTSYFVTNASVSATPGIYGKYVIFPSWNGVLYAFDKTTNQLIWSKDIRKTYFPKLSAARVNIRTTPAFYGTSFLVGTNGPAYILRIDIATGTLIRKVIASSHIAAIITMSGSIYQQRFYVGVSSSEESMAADPNYICCSFVGSFLAIDIPTMKIVWTWYSIPPNLVGPAQFSGNALWGSSPVIDPNAEVEDSDDDNGKGAVYIATGNNYKISDELNSCYNTTAEAQWEVACNQVYAPENWLESVVALNLQTGKLIWGHRLTSYDAWTVACLYGSGNPNCPANPGEDADFGMAPVLSKVSGKNTLFIGQKNGLAHSINPVNGNLLWSTQSCPGGLLGGFSWGISVDNARVYASCINYYHLPWTLLNGTVINGGGWVAMDKRTGQQVWTTANPANFDPSGGVFDPASNGRAYTSWGIGPITTVNDIVLVTSADSVYRPNLGTGSAQYGSGGYAYSLNKKTGKILSSFETKAGLYGGFSSDTHCVYVGFGYSFLSSGKGVYGWCIPNN